MRRVIVRKDEEDVRADGLGGAAGPESDQRRECEHGGPGTGGRRGLTGASERARTQRGGHPGIADGVEHEAALLGGAPIRGRTSRKFAARARACSLVVGRLPQALLLGLAPLLVEALALLCGRDPGRLPRRLHVSERQELRT